jgi:protein-S-isoprenylcysteine O-methyltransferase Ste14
MTDYSLRHQIRSLVLPLIVVIVVPLLLVVRTNPLSIQYLSMLPYLQIPFGCLLFGVGLLLLVVTIRLFIRIGKGTLAPWDPTQRLVTEGVYGHVRNPMISGVSSMVLRVNSARLLDSIGLVLCRCHSKHHLLQTF